MHREPALRRLKSNKNIWHEKQLLGSKEEQGLFKQHYLDAVIHNTHLKSPQVFEMIIPCFFKMTFIWREDKIAIWDG